MLKNLVGLECKIEERIVKFICDNDCPISHLKEALFQFQKYIGQIEDMAKAKQEQEKAPEPVVENKLEEEIKPVEEAKPE